MFVQKLTYISIAVLIIFSISLLCEGSSVASAQYNMTHHHGHNNNDTYQPLKCYSCISIEKFPNMSAEGCGKRHPPSHYFTQDCFGYNSPQALAAIRHQAASGKWGLAAEDPLNVHCVHMTGRNDAGGEITVRGCTALPREEVYQTKTCMAGDNIDFIPIGTLQGVEYCYCKGAGCNSSSKVKGGTMLNWIMIGITVGLLNNKMR